MKQLLLIAVLTAYTINSFGQDTAIYYSQVRTVDSVDKSAIYSRVKLWLVSSFKSTMGVLQVDDKENGILAFDASTTAISPFAPSIKDSSDKELFKIIPFMHEYVFRFKIQIKDGKYKIDISDVYYKNVGESYALTSATKAPYKYMFSKQSKADAEWADVKITFAKFAKDMFLSLHDYVVKKEDW